MDWRRSFLRGTACFAALPILAFLASAQPKPDTALTREQAAKDTLRLIELLELSHPDPYTNMGGKVAFKAKARDLAAAIPENGLAVSELGNRLNTFLARLHDGHTNIRSDKWQDPAWWMPVEFEIASDGLFVSASDLPALAGTRGRRLIAANGLPVDAIRERVSREIASENVYGEYQWVTHVLRSEKFSRAVFPGSGDSVVYTLQAPDGRVSEHKIAWTEKRQWNPNRAAEPVTAWSGVEAPDLFYYRLLDEQHTAYLRVRTMMGREGYETLLRGNIDDAKSMIASWYRSRRQTMPENIEEALAGIPGLTNVAEDLLREMKRRGTLNLIVDLRGNGGGVSSSAWPFLYEMYGDRFYAVGSKMQSVRVESQLYLDKYHTTVEERRKQDPGFRVGNYRWTQDEGGDGKTLRKLDITRLAGRNYSWAPRLAALDGVPIYTPKKVVVLCDAGTFSAAFHFMVRLRELGAKVVGVASAQSPNAFMEQTEFQLSESGLRGSIANALMTAVPEEPRATVLHPDFEIDYATFARFDFDRHTAVRYALRLLANGAI